MIDGLESLEDIIFGKKLFAILQFKFNSVILSLSLNSYFIRIKYFFIKNLIISWTNKPDINEFVEDIAGIILPIIFLAFLQVVYNIEKL